MCTESFFSYPCFLTKLEEVLQDPDEREFLWEYLLPWQFLDPFPKTGNAKGSVLPLFFLLNLVTQENMNKIQKSYTKYFWTQVVLWGVVGILMWVGI